MSQEPPSQAQALSRAMAGDSEAFGELVTPHLALFHNAIFRILGNASDTQDALQDALMSIHRDLPGFQGRSAFSSWGYRICVNSALMFRRSRVRRREDSMDDAFSGPDEDAPRADADTHLKWSVDPEALAALEREELKTWMLGAMDQLSDSNRVVFALKELEDWSTESIGTHLDIPTSVVRQRLHRARLFMQSSLRGYLQGRDT